MKINFEYTDLPTQNEETESANLNRLICKKLDGITIDKAIVIPGRSSMVDECFWGEVFDENGGLVKNVNSNTNYADFNQSNSCLNFQGFTKIKGSIIYLGAIPTGWGHYITDGMSKLWFLRTSLFQELRKKGYKLALTGMYTNVESCPGSLKQLFSLLHIDVSDLLFITEPTQFEHVCVPDDSLFIQNNTRFYTKEYTEIVQRLIDAVPVQKLKNKYQKIYFSRTKFHEKRTEFGELAIEKAFKSMGYVIVYPEKHSAIEQINLCRQAKSIVVTEGSVAHNSLFCSNSTEVIIIRKAFYTNDYQYVINSIRNLNVTYIDAHLSVFTNDQPNMGPFFIYINDNMVRFFKDHYGADIKNNFSPKKFLQYTNKCLRYTDFYERRDAPKFYFDKLQAELVKQKSFLRVIYRQFLGSLSNKHRDKIRTLVSKFTR